MSPTPEPETGEAVTLPPAMAPEQVPAGPAEQLAELLRDRHNNSCEGCGRSPESFVDEARELLAAVLPGCAAALADELEAHTDPMCDGSSWDGGVGFSIAFLRGEPWTRKDDHE